MTKINEYKFIGNGNPIPIITLKINDIPLNFMIDTGSDRSYIDESYLNKLNAIKTDYGIRGTTYGTGLKENVKHFYNIPCCINGNTDNLEVLPMDTSTCEQLSKVLNITVHGLLGSYFLRDNKYVIDYYNQTIYSYDLLSD